MLKFRSLCFCICRDGICLIFMSCNFKIMAGRNKICKSHICRRRGGLLLAPISRLTEPGVNISSRELTLMLKLTTIVINGWKIKYDFIFRATVIIFCNKRADAALVQNMKYIITSCSRYKIYDFLSSDNHHKRYDVTIRVVGQSQLWPNYFREMLETKFVLSRIK